MKLLNATEPLCLPRGSVRAILTILLVIVLAVSLFVPLAHGADEVRSGLLALAVISIRDYFTVRTAQNVSDGPPLPAPAVNGQE